MSIKILLADDSITIQKVIGIIFGGEEYLLTVVDNGKAAVEKAREVSPDVLLIDAIMPGMSGYEVCEAIRAIPALNAKPILLLTGSFEPFDEAKARSCGADDFLAKPFESQQIVAKIREMSELGASRSSAASQAVTPGEPLSFELPAMPTEAPTVAGPVQEVNTEDIWGAFSPAAEPAPVAPLQPKSPEAALDPDVFAIISEEPEIEIAPLSPTSAAQSESSGSEWIPVEENTFEFEEEAVAEIPASSITGLEPPDQEVSFGEISFEEEPQPFAAMASAAPEPAPVEAFGTAAFAEPAPSFVEPAAPAFSEPAAPAIAAAPGFVELQAAVIAASAESAPITLTEAQLKTAITGVSQDVIERIVWEVVPDLAETLIKEAIRRIKEGL